MTICNLQGSPVHEIQYSGKNTGVGNHALLQRIFPTQGLQVDSLPSEPPGKPQRADGILSLIFCVRACMRAQSFTTPWTVACQAPLSKEFSRQEYWSGLPFPTPGDLPNQGLNPGLLH